MSTCNQLLQGEIFANLELGETHDNLAGHFDQIHGLNVVGIHELIRSTVNSP